MAEHQLHVWGPAFGLPSIDAECLATIIYFAQAVPASDWGRWQIIYSNDPSVSPSNQLPALRHGQTWISGYRDIVKYLTQSANAALKPESTHAQEAELFAMDAYLITRFSALLDLSLYVSPSNWAAVTRPAYSKILTFPLTWVVPPRLRSAAVQRVSKYGFSDLDADGDSGEADTSDDHIPETMRWRIPGMRQKRVMDEMTPEQAMGIRLYAFATDVLEVVQSWVASGALGSGTEISPAACQVFSYLALITQSKVPQAWLSRLLAAEFPQLSQFQASVEPRLLANVDWSRLPTVHETPSVPKRLSWFVYEAIDSVPELGLFQSPIWDHGGPAKRGIFNGRLALIGTSLLASGTAILYLYRAYQGSQPFGLPLQTWITSRGRRSKLGEFGELGEMLGFSLGLQNEGNGHPQSQSVREFGMPQHSPVLTEMELDVD